MITDKDVAIRILQTGKDGFKTEEEGFRKLNECIALINTLIAQELNKVRY